MESRENSPPDVELESAQEGKEEDGGLPPTKKPGSKAQGRKRTKSGCLSM